MIKIIAVILLAMMCFLITENLTMIYSKPQEFFMWGWISSIATGFLTNWFIRSLDSDS